MTQDFFKAETTKQYGVPLTHLDYTYIRECTDVKELEKILRILRSGDEGCYPELEREAEGRVEQLNPKSRTLRKDKPVQQLRDLEKTERDGLSGDLEEWKSQMSKKEQVGSRSLSRTSPAVGDACDFNDDPNLPPVRSCKVISVDGKVIENANDEKSAKKKPLPRSYKEWDKFDIDKELEKADEEGTTQNNDTTTPSNFKPERIANEINTQGMTKDEKNSKAIREKEKGNEAFHAHDYEESIVYYSRSLSIAPLAATFNNRALAYLRQSKWNEAIDDCNAVLKREPKNIKAFLRRGTALKGKKDFVAARADLETVSEIEPNNKTAQDQLKEIEKMEAKSAKEKEERKTKGRRMIIEEVESEDNEEAEEIVVEKPMEEKKTKPAKNTGDQGKSSKAATIMPKVQEFSESNSPHIAKNLEDKKEEISRKNKDIWNEEETCESFQKLSTVESDKKDYKQDRKSGSKLDKNADSKADKKVESKPQLIATNILLDERDKPKVTAAAKEGEGEEDGAKAEGNQTPTPGGTAAGGAEARLEAEESPADQRPVFVQKVLAAADADLRLKGNDMFKSGQYPEAVRVYTTLITRLAKLPDQTVNLSLIYSNRAACHLKTGDCQSAIADCTASLSLVPHACKPLLRRASAYETMEKYRQAYVDFKHVITLDSSVALAHEGSTRCQRHLRDTDGLQWRDKLPPLTSVLLRDIPVITDETTASTSQAQVLQSPTSPLPKAAPQSSQVPAQKTQPAAGTQANPEKMFEETKTQGNKHVQKGEYAEAEKCYCRCVALFSDRPAVYTNRALCYLKLNRAKEAEADCNTALKLEHNNCKAFYRRALARKEQKQYKESLQDLLQLLRLEPSNGAAKKEMETVKKLYKEEFDQMKGQPVNDKPKVAEKQRKRMKIEEIDDADETERDNRSQYIGSPRRETPLPSRVKPSTAPTPGAANSVHLPTSGRPTVETKKAEHVPTSGRPQSEPKRPGRGKSKKANAKEAKAPPPPQPPKAQGKITPFEFLQHWNSLKQAKEIQPYVQLLDQVAPDDLPGVISNKLDGHMLQIISRCAAHDAQTGEVERGYSILRNLRQVPRFSTVSMFLSNKERQDLKKVLDSISSLGTHPPEEVASVRKDYGLK